MGVTALWPVENICLRMKLVLALLSLAAYQVSADGSFTGELACCGHLNTDVSTPEGGGYLERGQMSCNIVEWDGSSGLGPEAMFFKPQSGADFEIWAWDYHDWGNWPIPYAECEGDIWYKKDDMGAGYCTCTPAHCPPASPWTNLAEERSFTGCGYASCVGTITCYDC